MANLLQSEPLFFTVASLSTLLFLASFLYLLLLGGDHGGADAGGHFDAGGGHFDAGGGHVDASGGHFDAAGGHVDASGGHFDAGGGHVDAGDGSVFDGSADAQHLDGSVDGQHLDSALSFKVFTTQSILAFLMGFGWLGLACREQLHLGYLLSVPIATAFGTGLMFFTAYLMSQLYRLNAVRTRNLYETLGDDAKVYLTIPEDGRGKVQAVVDGGLKTLDAVSKSGRIEQFKDVEIVGVEDQSTLIVREK